MSGRLLNGRYRLDSLIGRGGMAEVWRGEDQRLGRRVAVKLLDHAGTVDSVVFARFTREARTVARLSHPNIVAAHDFGFDGDTSYLVMELIEGDSLATRLAAGPLTVGDAVAIAGQICDALAAAHAAGIVHRDIKPANVLLTPAGTVKVCDFGIARLQHGGHAGLTATNTVIGTSDYMAPEQASGGPVDARTDLYALGCVLYAMLTGTPPFTGDNPLSVLSQHLHRTPAPVATQRPGVPAALAALVDSLLAKRPEDRPASAAEVRSRLAAMTALPSTDEATGAADTGGAEAGTAASPAPVTRALPTEPLTPTAPRPDLSTRWRRVAVAAGAVMAAGVAGIAVIGLLNAPHPEEAGPITAPTIVAPSASSVATDPTEQAEVLLAAIDDQVAANQLDPQAGADLREMVGRVLEELDEEGAEDAAREAADLQEELDELRADERISEAAYAVVTSAVDSLVDSLPGTTLTD